MAIESQRRGGAEGGGAAFLDLDMFRFLVLGVLVLGVKISAHEAHFQCLMVSPYTANLLQSMGGAKKTFACKSQECLWQDWYIC